MPDLKNHIADFWAFNNSSVENTRNSLFFIFILFYILVIVVSTTDVQLLLPNSTVTLPVLGIDIPLVEFYIFIPFLILVFHFNLLFNFHQHSKKVYLYQSIEQDVNGRTIYPFALNYAINSPSTFNQRFLKLIIWLIIFVFPLFLLILVQWQFSAYHSLLITTWHFVVLLLDALVLSGTWYLIFQPEILPEEEIEIPKTHLKDLLKKIRFSWTATIFLLVGLFNYVTLFTFKMTSGEFVKDLLPHLDISHATLIASPPSDEIIQRYLAQGKSKEEAYRDFAGGIDLSGRDLRYYNFSGAYLVNITLDDADLRGANLFNADLNGAMLSRTNLGNANLNNVTLNFALMDSCNLESTSLKFIDFSFAQLANLTLEKRELERVIFDGVVLQNASFKEVDLDYSSWVGALLANCSFEGCSLNEANLNGVQFHQKNRLDGVSLVKTTFKATDWTGVTLQGSDLKNADLSGSVFSNAELSGINMTAANLQGTLIKESQLSGISFNKASVDGLQFDGGKSQAIFSKTLDTATVNDWNAQMDDFQEADDKNYTTMMHMFLPENRIMIERHNSMQMMHEAETRTGESQTDSLLIQNQAQDVDAFMKVRKEMVCKSVYIAEGLLNQSMGENELDQQMKEELLTHLKNNCPTIYQELQQRNK